MAETGIHVARDGIELGVFDAEEVRELLETDFLFPSDKFWIHDSRETRMLAEFPLDNTSRAEKAREKMTMAVLTAAEMLRQKTADLAAKVSATAAIRKQEIDLAKNRLLEDYLPRLQNTVGAALAGSSRTVESALRDEPFLRKLFGAMYDVLPRPVQRFVTEKAFIEFCLKRRDHLLRKRPEGD